jgi:hypothetical protein
MTHLVRQISTSVNIFQPATSAAPMKMLALSMWLGVNPVFPPPPLAAVLQGSFINRGRFVNMPETSDPAWWARHAWGVCGVAVLVQGLALAAAGAVFTTLAHDESPNGPISGEPPSAHAIMGPGLLWFAATGVATAVVMFVYQFLSTADEGHA